MSEKLITRSQAYKEIAKVLFPDDQADKESRDKTRRSVKARAKRAEKAGKITRSDFANESFCRWVRDVWPTLGFHEWMPESVHHIQLFAKEKMDFRDEAGAIGIPGDRTKLEEQYVKSEREREALAAECDEQGREIKSLQQVISEFRAKDENDRRRQSEVGKRGGRGKKLW
ncbi:MAG: hypothetical protein U9Q81_20190 [Pseudomonadota bacterium]|nr:hypothetical protein [Pseudomonadota bacterium]